MSLERAPIEELDRIIGDAIVEMSKSALLEAAQAVETLGDAGATPAEIAHVLRRVANGEVFRR